jgi:hypothetical protein
VSLPRALLAVSLALIAGCAPAAPAAAPAPVAASPAIGIVADSARSAEVAPGVVHRYYWLAKGPWAVHLVEAAPQACGVEVRARKAGGRLVGRATTSALASEVEAETGRAVLAAINADFFNFTPPGVPTGAHVEAGRILRGPSARPAFGVTEDGSPFIDVVTLAAALEVPAGVRAPVGALNTRPEADGLALYDRYVGEQTPADTGAVEVVVRKIDSTSGDSLRGVVIALDTLPEGVGVPADGVVLAGRGRGATFLRHLALPGDTLRWSVGFAGVPGPVREMVGGHPRLLRAGEVVENTGSFATTRHPRSAVGWRADGTLLFVVVDGRQAGYSAGMSLAELTDLFQQLGAVEALNLDGGGSTALVVRGAVANRPSDASGERPVANALMLLGPPAGACVAPDA